MSAQTITNGGWQNKQVKRHVRFPGSVIKLLNLQHMLFQFRLSMPPIIPVANPKILDTSSSNTAPSTSETTKKSRSSRKKSHYIPSYSNQPKKLSNHKKVKGLKKTFAIADPVNFLQTDKSDLAAKTMQLKPKLCDERQKQTLKTPKICFPSVTTPIKDTIPANIDADYFNAYALNVSKIMRSLFETMQTASSVPDINKRRRCLFEELQQISNGSTNLFPIQDSVVPSTSSSIQQGIAVPSTSTFMQQDISNKKKPNTINNQSPLTDMKKHAAFRMCEYYSKSMAAQLQSGNPHSKDNGTFERLLNKIINGEKPRNVKDINSLISQVKSYAVKDFVDRFSAVAPSGSRLPDNQFIQESAKPATTVTPEDSAKSLLSLTSPSEDSGLSTTDKFVFRTGDSIGTMTVVQPKADYVVYEHLGPSTIPFEGNIYQPVITPTRRQPRKLPTYSEAMCARSKQNTENSAIQYPPSLRGAEQLDTGMVHPAYKPVTSTNTSNPFEGWSSHIPTTPDDKQSH